MFSITKKIAIAISLVVVCLGKAYACPTEVEIKRTTQAVASISALPLDVMPVILEEASKGSHHPVKFRLVSKEWTTLMDKVMNPNEKNTIQLHGDLLQKCINIWEIDGRKLWACERFKNGILKYTPYGKAEQILKFSDLGNECKGTFDLSTYEDVAKYLVITTDLERFFKVDDVSQAKLVTLIALYQDIAPYVDSLASPFASIIENWNPAKAPAIIACRSSEAQDLTLFDCLTSESLSEISSRYLYQNWRKRNHSRGSLGFLMLGMPISCVFLGKPK